MSPATPPRLPVDLHLAVLGAPPRFPRELHVGAPNPLDTEALLGRLRTVFERNRLTNGGPETEALEAEVARRVGVRHAVAVANATTGLQLLARALDWHGEVILPSFTFVATANALAWVGLTPVFCDVRPDTYTIDPAAVEGLITDRTVGIVGVHLWGRPCDVGALQRLAAAKRLDLVFDAAQAWGCSEGGVPIGRFGRAEVFSFHATKWVHGAEGGVITTNDAALAARCAALRNHGFAGYDRTSMLGINGKLSEVAAATVLESLAGAPRVLERNHANFRAYEAGLREVPGVRLVRPAPGDDWHAHNVVLEVDDAHAPLDRDSLHRVLWEEGVRARRYFHPGCHRLEPYCRQPLRAPLPVTERLARQMLSLPTGLQLEPAEVSAVCAVIRAACEAAPAVRARLGQLPPLEA